MLGVAQMQLIEIGKAISTESKVLILDEPTATLTPKEINRLFGIISRLKAKGVTIIYISHRLQETFEIGDRITVLRNGRKVATCNISEVTIPEIVKMMVGKEMGAEYPFKEEVVPGEEIFRVEDLRYKGNRHFVSFGLRQGELLGTAGLVGSGRTETMRAIFGADPRTSGRLFFRGKEITVKRPRDAVNHGICLLTEDRKGQGLILDMPLSVNITLTDLAQITRGGLLQKRLEKSAAEKLVEDLSIKTPSVDQWARYLSGGNQQKVVLAKWLFRHTDVLIFDEPTRGIDVGAKYEIYLLLWQLAAEGKGIIVVSSDLPELLGICHRIMVFSNGKITGVVDRPDFSQERILSLAYQEYIGQSPLQEETR
jgi:ribose transport system ATP-binding protein